MNTYKPKLYNLTVPTDKEAYDNLLKSSNGIRIIDQIEEQLAELAEIEDPTLIRQKATIKSTAKRKTVWAYYPWKNTLVHLLGRDDYEKVRLSRNEPIITKDEQEEFRESTVAFAGLNVGNPGALCMVLEGGPKKMKFADLDHVSLSNLNRFRAGVCELGLDKSILTAQQSYEVTPFLDIEMFENGVSDSNMDSFLLDPKVDLLIEETDNLPLKIKLREVAKTNKIPVLMVTGNGANVIIDIERYDLERDLVMLNGHINGSLINKISTMDKLPFEEIIKLMKDFMGSEFLTKRLDKSFEEVGIKYAGIPQISEATFLRGAALSYFARQILTTNGIAPSGRYNLNLEDIIK